MWLNLRKVSILLFLLLNVQTLNGQSIAEIENLIENSQYDQAIAQAKGLLSEASTPDVKARLIQLQADAYYYLNDIETSLQHYLEAIEIHEQQNTPDTFRYMECTSHAGFCYRELGIYDKALLQYLNALRLAQTLADSTEIAGQYANLGLIYGKLGDIEQATEYHMKAYNIDLALRDTAGIGFDLRNIADLKITLGDYNEAIKNIRESIDLLEMSSGNPNSLALRQGVLGKTYLAMDKLDSAEYYLSLSRNQHLAMNDSIHVALRWNDLAQYHLKKGAYQQAMSFANQAKAYFLSKADSPYLVSANLTLVKAHLGLKNTKEALRIITDNIALCESQELLVELRDTYQLQSRAFELGKNPYRALAALNSFQQIQDSIINLENKKSVALLEIKYEVYKKEQENEILALENELNKKQLANQQAQFLFTVIILVIVLVAIATIAYVLISQQRLKEKLLLAEVDQLRSEIKLAVEGDTTNWKIDVDSFNKSIDSPLSDREFEILNLALSDMSNGEIAEKTHVSVNTVKFHLKKIYEKIGVTSRKEALQFALKTGR